MDADRIKSLLVFSGGAKVAAFFEVKSRQVMYKRVLSIDVKVLIEENGNKYYQENCVH